MGPGGGEGGKGDFFLKKRERETNSFIIFFSYLFILNFF